MEDAYKLLLIHKFSILKISTKYKDMPTLRREICSRLHKANITENGTVQTYCREKRKISNTYNLKEDNL